MRLWTVHPRYLDSKGLVAVWTEGLLAQKILAGNAKGSPHPQLSRFRSQRDPIAAIGSYLAGVAEEAEHRHFNFDTGKISPFRLEGQVVETRGQLLYEWGLLKSKLQARAPETLQQLRNITLPEPHPLFRIVPGKVRDWEKEDESLRSPAAEAD